MVWILFEVHWVVVDEDGLDYYEESSGTKLEEQRPHKRTAVVQMRFDGDLG